MTPQQLIVQMFGLLPNLNWFAWYVFFYIFCMLVMPLLCKCRVFRFRPMVNLGLMLVVPYVFEVMLRFMPNYETSMIVHDLFRCFLYFPCFLVGYWMAENKVVERTKQIKLFRNPIICIVGMLLIFPMRQVFSSMAGFLLDVFYAPLLICLTVNLLESIFWKPVSLILGVLGKYSTGMWFFHAVFFSTYVCEWFQPVLGLVSWPPLMYVWLVILSLTGAFIYQKILDGLHALPGLMKGSL